MRMGTRTRTSMALHEGGGPLTIGVALVVLTCHYFSHDAQHAPFQRVATNPPTVNGWQQTKLEPCTGSSQTFMEGGTAGADCNKPSSLPATLQQQASTFTVSAILFSSSRFDSELPLRHSSVLSLC